MSSLTDHVSFLSQKIIFLLDATLGMINIEQNGIIKIVSVAAVVFLPPTLVASIYGMNFDIMPELKWLLGYPFALCPDGRVGCPSVLVLPAKRLALNAGRPAPTQHLLQVPHRRHCGSSSLNRIWL